MQHAIQLDLPGIAPIQLELALPEPDTGKPVWCEAKRSQGTARRS